MADNVEYIPCHGHGDINTIKVEVDYELGGTNYFSGGQNRRGYYLCVRPIRRERHSYGYSEGYDLFGSTSGKKKLLKEVGRKSAKALAEATLLAKQIKSEIIASVCSESGLTLDSMDAAV